MARRTDVRQLDKSERDEFRERPRPPSGPAVAQLLNGLAENLNRGHDMLSRLRHELGVNARFEDVVAEDSRRRSVLIAEEREAGAVPQRRRRR